MNKKYNPRCHDVGPSHNIYFGQREKNSSSETGIGRREGNGRPIKLQVKTWKYVSSH
jgi:hypothetical protein